VAIAGFRQKVLKAVSKEDFKKAMLKPSDKCSFLQTNKNYTDQHWYYCYTCGLSNNQGCCSVCVFTCHAGHDVAYSRKSNFFCDCGDVGQCIARVREEGEEPAFAAPFNFGGQADKKIPQPSYMFNQPPPSDLGLGLFAGGRMGGAKPAFDPGMFLQRGFEDANRGRGGRGRPSGPGRGGRRVESGLFASREPGSEMFGYREEFERIIEAERAARGPRDFGGEEDLQEMILREQELMEEEQQFLESAHARANPWKPLNDHVDEESDYKQLLEKAKQSM